ncbi:hypothetical protein E2C01_047265 [Portunus trituberculatus]|uniref:Uncharacterized protein n=1 Tax=Portunus trituberculatus TaxID=210409 RepID=A0A5B7G7A0_PORTR|nr:hypothetical protein [Portunus trituberculatus]
MRHRFYILYNDGQKLRKVRTLFHCNVPPPSFSALCDAGPHICCLAHITVDAHHATSLISLWKL